jgi:TnpA family transposase
MAMLSRSRVGRSDLASSDMMSLETTKRVWQARLDPRRQTPSMGLYSHVRDRWGIFLAQPLILNDQRQAGAAIEGVIRHEELDITLLAVDTHGHTDFAMALSKLLGFDLCPRLKALKDRHLFLPRGTAIPASVQICRTSVDLERIRSHWEQIVHLVAFVHSGHASATHVTARFGSAARGDPLYEAIVDLGRLLRTVFLCDYFLNDVFRRELLRVLNRGEAVNALKRAIYTGPHRQPSGQTVRGDAGSCRCLKLARQYRHGLEHRPDAASPRSLGAASRRQRPARAHRTHRPDSNRGHQPAWDIPIPSRALRRQNPTVCHCQDNQGRKRVRGQNRAAIPLVNDDQNPAQNQTLARWSPWRSRNMPSRYRMLLRGK